MGTGCDFPVSLHLPEIGLSFSLNRFFDPVTARFASMDPLGVEGRRGPMSDRRRLLWRAVLFLVIAVAFIGWVAATDDESTAAARSFLRNLARYLF